MMSKEYRKELQLALITLQNMPLFYGEMFVYRDWYFWVTDNGGEVNVQLVNSRQLPVSIPYTRSQSGNPTPAALSCAIRECAEAWLEHPQDGPELRDAFFPQLLKWLQWVDDNHFWWNGA